MGFETRTVTKTVEVTEEISVVSCDDCGVEAPIIAAIHFRPKYITRDLRGWYWLVPIDDYTVSDAETAAARKVFCPACAGVRLA